MVSKLNFWEVARRAETGPMMKEDEFDLKISDTATELAQEYDIGRDPDVFIPSDDDMADKTWEAGIELLAECGVYNTSNRRVIKFTEEEIKKGLKHATKDLEVGKGRDKVELKPRNVEGNSRPVIFSGPFGVEVTLDTFVELNQAFANEPLIDILFHGGHIQSVDGIDEIRNGSAFEVMSGRTYAELMDQAITLAGRPGMPVVWGIAAGITSLNELAADSVNPENKEDIFRAVMFMPELKLNDVLLSKIGHFLLGGYPIYAGETPILGGYAGGPGTTAIVAVATQLALLLTFQAEVIHIGPQHVKYRSQTNPDSIWMNSLMGQAVARNSDLITLTSVTTSGRPESMQMHMESSALGISSVVSGRHVLGPRPAEPLYPNHHNPLHSRLFAKVARAATKLKREEADEIVGGLVETYKDKLEFKEAPKGKTFEESYDTGTLKPTEENLKLYEEAKSKLIDLGLEIDG